MPHQLSTIEAAVEAIAAGKLVIVMDDENRENEGDFIGAAEKVTPETVNFMITHGRGQLCMLILPEVAQRLELPPLVQRQHRAVQDGVYGSCGSSQRPDGHHRARAGEDDSRNPQSREQAFRFRPAGSPLSIGGEGRGRAPARRTHRVRRRSCPDGRAQAGRRAHRDSRPARRSGDARRAASHWPRSSTSRSSRSRR